MRALIAVHLACFGFVAAILIFSGAVAGLGVIAFADFLTGGTS